MPVFFKKERNDAAKTAAAMCTACCDFARPHPPIPTLFASTKPIVPTDNMQSKLHDEYTCHQWLKG